MMMRKRPRQPIDVDGILFAVVTILAVVVITAWIAFGIYVWIRAGKVM